MLAMLAGVLSQACGGSVPAPVFAVSPALVCPGGAVNVSWDVHAEATLRAERSPTDFDEDNVAASGKRTVNPLVPTTYSLKLRGVNAANGPSFGDQPVEVPKLFDERMVMATCVAATGRCTGSFDPDASAARLHVRKLSSPHVSQLGHTKAMEVCVTHDGLPRTCVGPEKAIDVDLPASGTWTLDAARPTDAPAPAQIGLKIHLDFVCQ